MSQGKEPSGGKRTVSFLCDYLGISRQGYDKHVDRWLETNVLRSSIVLYAMDILKDIPKAGMRELYELCRLKFGLKFTIGRDQCYGIFRSNGLCQRNRKHPGTTYSNHNYFIYGNLLNTTPKLRPTGFGELCVADITNVATNTGWAYLSLVTNAASRVIVGWNLHPTLGKEGPIGALNMALECYRSYGIDPAGLIHHSDRGVQYCCNEYTALLKASGIRISMTQTGDPLHNALAERMNNTVKNGWLFDTRDKAFEKVRALVAKVVELYNTVRPHQSLGMRTPRQELLRLIGHAA